MILGIAVIGAFITYLICAKILACISVFFAIVGISLFVYAYIENSGKDKLGGAMSTIASFIVIFMPIDDPKDKTIQLAFKFADERIEGLKEEIYLRDKTIEVLKEELARKDLPTWEQVVRDYLEKGKLQEAIESIDTNVSDEEAAQKHIRKAQLYITNFQFTEAEQHYKQAVAVFPSYDNNFAIAAFYYRLNKLSEAITYYNHCLSLVTLPQERAAVLHDMGCIQYKNNAYREAEASYKGSLKIGRELASKNRDAYLPSVARILNNLGVLHYSKNEYSEAEAFLKEALKIRRELVPKSRDAYLPDVAMNLNNLGELYRSKNEYSSAEAFYKEALEIQKELASKNQDAYLPDVALILNNLGALYYNKNEYSEAEVFFVKTLKIRRELASKNQDAYLPDVALILNNLGALYCCKNEYSTSEAFYKEALKIRRELASKSRDAYLPDVAQTLVNLSMFYQDDAPNKKLSLQYAREAMEVLGKCNHTPTVQEYLDDAKRVIEAWN